MPKRPNFAPGQIYHLYNRGAHRVSIFREKANYDYLLYTIKSYSCELKISILAYVLMPNHYHLLVRQDSDTRAGALCQRVFNRYSKAYNKRYHHSSTLFEGPYEAKGVETERHLCSACIYIHANPVKDGFVTHPKMWTYSNYREWIGTRKGTLYDPTIVQTYFHGNRLVK